MIDTSSLRVTEEIASLLAELDSFKKTWRTLRLPPERLAVLRHTAVVESIGASTRIEGSKLSDRAVDDLLFAAPPKPLTTRDEQEAGSYAAALETILNHWKHIPLTEGSIKALHRDLLEHCARDQQHRGRYKKTGNHLEAFGLDGKKLGITFRTASPADTPRLMKELLAWTEKAFARRSLHPLLVTGIFIIVFLEIHPFQDGHGRLSRLLTTFLLLRFGYSYASYSSLETVIERTRKDYYAALRKTHVTIRTESPDWQPWLMYFLKSLQKQKRRLESKVTRRGNAGAKELPALSAAMIDVTRARCGASRAKAGKLSGK